MLRKRWRTEKRCKIFQILSKFFKNVVTKVIFGQIKALARKNTIGEITDGICLYGGVRRQHDFQLHESYFKLYSLLSYIVRSPIISGFLFCILFFITHLFFQILKKCCQNVVKMLSRTDANISGFWISLDWYFYEIQKINSSGKIWRVH